MAFIEASDKYQKWRYDVNELYILFSDGSQIPIHNHQVKSITISHLYEQNLFPIFRVELTLASTTYYKIIKNKNNVKFKIRIQKYYIGLDDSTKSLKRDWINDTYDLILDDDDYNSDEEILKEKKKKEFDTVIDKTIDEDLFQVDNTIEFFLFKSDLVNKFNTIVNAILSDATINDGIQYIASKINLNNLLMTNSHNTNTYSELIIPPLNAKQAIKFLDTYYGIYKTGMLFYVDTIANISYLLEYSGKCTAYQPDELHETNILIPLKTSKRTSDLGSLYRRGNTEKYFIIGDNTRLSIRNETVSYNAYASTDAKVVDTFSGTITTSNTTATVKDTKSIKIIENNTENKWFSDIYNSLINAKNTVIDIPLADYDISAIAPNKSYKMVFEDSSLSSKYKKSWLLSEATHCFMKEGESFTLTTIVKLKQI